MLKRKRRYRSKNKLKLKGKSLRSLLAVALFLSAIITLFSFFGQAADVGSLLQVKLNLLFGWGTFLLPFLLADLGLIFFDYRRNRYATPLFFVGLVLFFLCFVSLLHFFLPSSTSQTEALMGEGGGVVGYYIQLILRQSISSFLAFLILIAGIISAVLILLNTSLDVFVNKIGIGVGYLYRNIDEAILQKLVLLINKYRAKQSADVFEGKETVTYNAGLSDQRDSAEDKSTETVSAEPSFELIKPAFVPVYPEGSMAQKVAPRVETVSNLRYPEKVWEYPPITMLSEGVVVKPDQSHLNASAKIIEDALESFGVQAKVVEVNLGPAITQYALELTHGTKISKVTNLQHDLAMALATSTGSVRIEAPIPGKSLVGIEVPNAGLKLVNLKSVLTSKVMQEAKSVLAVALGEDVSGRSVIADIAKMPHVLIAGSTGSGKSVLVNTIIATILFRCSPDEVKLILVDPKRVELVQYRDIPHLLTDVIVEPSKVIKALNWAMSQMDLRYRLFEKAGVRNIAGYNEVSGFQALPYIVIIIDELAEVIMTAPREVETAICRLAQLARATGIHLIIATQRPSVDILTGLIKANIPCRIAFKVSSMVDSRVIIDMPGAEKLLGKGDMLFIPPESSKPLRIQGVYVSDREINALIDFLKQSGFKPDYKEEIVEYEGGVTTQESSQVDDALFAEALEMVVVEGTASTSLLQRRLKIGYNRAADLMEELEKKNVVSSPDGSKKRHVLVTDVNQILKGKTDEHKESGGDSASGEIGKTPYL